MSEILTANKELSVAAAKRLREMIIEKRLEEGEYTFWYEDKHNCFINDYRRN